jgi:SSS family solute:Na+ symporter
MGDVLANWRGIPQWGLFLVFVPIVAYTFWHGPAFADAAASVRPVLDGLGSDALRSQLTVPLALTKLLPVGLMGAFAAVMLAAAVGCNETYLHSWGCIFIQDVVMPIRKKPFAQAEHIRLLKLSILGVAAFSFVFSLLFQQSEYIFLFFAITGAIFAGGSGAVIIGGLYWKRGTTAAAWSAMIVGAVTAVGGIIVQQLVPDFPINGQMFWGLAMALSSVVYVVVSLLTGHGQAHDMDKMLHRGEYRIKEEYTVVDVVPVKGWKVLGMGREFTRWDKVIYVATYAWTAGWVVVFVVGTILNLTRRVGDGSWMHFWKTYTMIYLVVSIAVIVWFSVGGIIDLKKMIGALKIMKRDHSDTGFVDRGRG